jgi:hypothetical protein
LMRFHRQEQMKKLKALLRSFLKFKKVDSFSLTAARRETR